MTHHDDLTEEEKVALIRGIELAMKALSLVLSPNGFNIGINIGETAGQTVEHIHVHVIPRYRGDCRHPRGGVRKAVLDIEDENLAGDKERWLRNRLGEKEIRALRRALNEM
ncbi:histidine triad protein [Pyrococcus yayanosii CH1]|uniref:Histidine triad protein n=1 Tax=Pyrococcus yayanosii (strain CH1 / JCM 16557) TaxID=529709 RepID=F8AHF5_PYRYC|nr:histidine triad protein [Pyrococcus yayanosii CH1]